jgi:hypothetical protein
MIKFFRKIRYDFMNQNKTGKYFKYAIGEIVLVVIGILIALQINNWNADLKTAKEELSILNNLLESLYSAKEQSDIEISKEIKMKDALLMALGKGSAKSQLNVPTISDSLFFDILWNANPTLPVINTYSDIKTTGKIGIIKSRSIRESFTNLELTLTNLSSMVTDRLTLQQMRIDDIIINDVNFVRLLNSIEPNINIDNESENDYNSILNNQKIRNSLALKLSLTSAAIKHRKELGDEIDDLIQLVEVELNKEA